MLLKLLMVAGCLAVMANESHGQQGGPVDDGSSGANEQQLLSRLRNVSSLRHGASTETYKNLAAADVNGALSARISQIIESPKLFQEAREVDIDPNFLVPFAAQYMLHEDNIRNAFHQYILNQSRKLDEYTRTLPEEERVRAHNYFHATDVLFIYASKSEADQALDFIGRIWSVTPKTLLSEIGYAGALNERYRRFHDERGRIIEMVDDSIDVIGSNKRAVNMFYNDVADEPYPLLVDYLKFKGVSDLSELNISSPDSTNSSEKMSVLDYLLYVGIAVSLLSVLFYAFIGRHSTYNIKRA